MFKEKILKLFLSLPLTNEIAEFLINVFFKKQTFMFALKNSTAASRNKTCDFYENFVNSDTYDWFIQIASPKGEKSKFWGDTYFAHEIAEALRRSGQNVRIVFREEDISKSLTTKSIVLNIRGLMPLTTYPNALNLIWVISHPTQISKRELAKYDLIFAASDKWSLEKINKWNLKIVPLLQATNPNSFNTRFEENQNDYEFLFVGNTRNKFREIIKIANDSPVNLKVIGKGWSKFIPTEKIEADFIENEHLASRYHSADYVLADHWKDMAENGFISNRLFDAVASGAKIVSDFVPGSKEIFKSSVVEYKNKNELSKLLNSNLSKQFGSVEELRSIASEIHHNHNFEKRAETLILNVRKFIIQQT